MANKMLPMAPGIWKRMLNERDGWVRLSRIFAKECVLDGRIEERRQTSELVQGRVLRGWMRE